MPSLKRLSGNVSLLTLDLQRMAHVNKHTQHQNRNRDQLLIELSCTSRRSAMYDYS
jgi:hypothetical protein